MTYGDVYEQDGGKARASVHASGTHEDAAAHMAQPREL
jgi:hypothetical protein